MDEEERPASKSLCGGLPGSPRALGGQENFAPGLGDYDQVPPDAVLESRGENQGKVGQHFRSSRSGIFSSIFVLEQMEFSSPHPALVVCDFNA